MRESKFVEQNRKNWEEFEVALQNNSKDPESLYKLFTQVTEDLSYSRTFYKNRSVKNYLNALAQQSFFKIYKSVHLNKWAAFKQFWITDLPKNIWACRKSILLSFILFAVSVAIGGLSTRKSLDFAQLILGNDYIQKTLENISKGDPMGIYKDQDMFGMTLGITVNNILVSFFAYLLGILWGVGTFVLIVRNGIMLGCFQYFFYEKGLLKEMLLTIWLHGTLEISAIIIAGGAGFELAKGLVMPGTFSRIQAFRASAQKGLVVMIGLIPIFMIAGFIEGFITRHTEMFWGIKLALILFSLFFVLFYYVYYPYLVHKKNPLTLENYQSNPTYIHEILYNQIKNTRQIIAESFMLYGKNIIKNISNAALWSIPTLITYYYVKKNIEEIHFNQYLIQQAKGMFANSLNNNYVLIILSLSIAGMLTRYFRKENDSIGISISTLILNFIAIFPIIWFLAIDSVAFILILTVFAMPILIYMKTFLELEKGEFFAKLSYSIKYLGKGVYYTGIKFTLVYIGLWLAVFYVFNNFIWEYIETILNWHLNDKFEHKQTLIDLFNYFILLNLYIVFWQLYATTVNLWYYSSLEIHEANGLREKIKDLELNELRK